MRTLRFFGMVVLSILMSVSFFACSDVDEQITQIKISEGPTLEVLINTSGTLSIKYEPDYLDAPNLSWTSSDDDIVSIDRISGKYTAKNVGKATIKVTAQDLMLSDQCEVTVKPIEASNIKLNCNEKTLFVGEEFELTATIEPQDATYKEITWTSSDSKIATISNDGKVKALQAGKCTITAATKDGKKQASCTILVNPVEIKSIALNFTEKELFVDEDFTLEVSFDPENATYKDIEWSSDNEKIATVDKDGKVKAIKDGKCIITATTKDGKHKAECSVLVKPINVESITFSLTEKEIEQEEEFTIEATVAPENATYKELSWSSSNPEVASVDNGKVVGLSVGDCIITATDTTGNIKAECTVKVKPISVKGITLSTSSIKMMVGDTQKLTWQITPSNAANQEISWEVDDSNVVSIANDGTITALKLGETVVRVKTRDGNYTAECKVSILDITDMVSSYFGSSSIISINGYIRGNISCYFSNESPKNITLKSIQLIDSNSGTGGNVMSLNNENVAPGTMVGYTITIKLPVYEPIFRWTYICDGKEYTLDKHFTSKFSASKYNVKTISTIEM